MFGLVGRRFLNALSVLGPTVTGLILALWFILVIRVIPVPAGDYGLFVSVAERLRAGDLLYVDVFERKDPLFLYSLALARSLTPYAGWLLEIGWILTSCIAVFALARRCSVPTRASALTGFIAAPLIVTGVAYTSGVTHLPGVALTMVVFALLTRNRWWQAGALLAVLGLFKLIMLPVALVLIIVYVIATRAWKKALLLVVAAGIALLLIILLMVLRGEFVPYLDSLRSSVDYSQYAQSGGGIGAFVTHITSVFTLGAQVSVMTSLTIVMVTRAKREKPFSRERDLLGWALGWGVLTSIIVSTGVIAETGLWFHHAQILEVPALLALVLLVARGPMPNRDVTGYMIGSTLGFTILLSGLPGPGVFLNTLEYARGNIFVQTAVPFESRILQASGPPTTYARVGGGNDGGHATGLGEWKLVCPRIGQSEMDPTSVLTLTLDCLPTAETLLVAADAIPIPGVPDWNDYIASVEGLLARSYSCEWTDRFRICHRIPV
jgi:hypothetical protein